MEKNIPSVITTGKNALSRKDFLFRRDRELQKDLQVLKECKKAAEKLPMWLMKELDLPQSKTRKLVARFLNRIFPGKAYEFMPDGLARFVAEETDAAAFMEMYLRTKLNNTQAVINNLSAGGQEEEAAIDQLEGDILTAEIEGWGADELLDLAIEKANEYLPEDSLKLIIDDQVKELFDGKGNSKLLSPEIKENRRQARLKRLKDNLNGRKEFLNGYGRAIEIGLEVLESIIFSYVDYVTFGKPANTIFSAAKEMAEGNLAGHASREVIIKQVQIAVSTLGHLADVVGKAPQYSVSSGDVRGFIQDANSYLQKKVRLMEENRNKFIALEDKRSSMIAATAIEDKTMHSEVETPVAN